MDAMTPPDVLVVGAGPVGMTTAILLAARGIRVVIVEKNAGTADDPKAISLDDESLRVFQRAGIADQVLRVIAPGTGTTYFDADGERLFDGRAAVPFRFGFPFKNPFAQPDLERVLHDALESHPLVDVRFDTELTSLREDADGVSTGIRDGDGSHTVHVAYVLGADGGRSTTRSLLGIPMSGRSHPDLWLVVDCLGDTHTERYGMHHGDPRRPVVIVPGLHGRCRYEFLLRPEESEATAEPPFALIQRLLAPHRDIEPAQVERAVVYRFHGLNAAEWRRGRVFLLGDAAHMMPPFAGQGLNSGIRDAANLTWKIAAVRDGSAGDGLLDTYALERRPHVAAVIRASERLGRVVMTTNERLARFRDAAVRRALATPEGRVFFETMGYRPSARLTEGALLDAESHPLVGTAIGQPRVFDAATHAVVPFDHLLGDGWCVLGVGFPDDAEWQSARGALSRLTTPAPRMVDVPLDDTVHDAPVGVHVAIDVDGRLVAEVEHARGCFVVVRPDRIVAAVAAPDAVAAACERLATRLAAGPPA